MNKTVLYIIIFCLELALQAQGNLVYNGDFEEYIDCPEAESSPFQNPKEIEKCIGWRAPTYGTSDYFNVCSQSPFVSVPINLGGEQVPYNGDGYLGGYFASFTGGAGDDGYNGIMWWEYIQGRTIEPLMQGKYYTFSMEVSLAEYSDLMINEIGVYLSQTPISSPNTSSLYVQPQIKFNKPSYFSDTLNWMHLETTFIANGGEIFLTIGNFKDNITTDTLRRYNYEPFIINPYVTYMYVDNVEIKEIEISSIIPNVFTPNDDGVNDTWQFLAGSSEQTISILNRWGQVIVEQSAHTFKWDGKTETGINCREGIYFYKISETNKTGFIQLLR